MAGPPPRMYGGRRPMGRSLTEEEKQNHPARYALCEVVSIYDNAIEFEPIHRVVMNVDVDDIISTLEGIAEKGEGEQKITVITAEGEALYHFTKTSHDMTVGTLQNFLDEYVKEKGCEIDYIHGDAITDELGAKPGNIGFKLPSMGKDQLFKTLCGNEIGERGVGQPHDTDCFITERFRQECIQNLTTLASQLVLIEKAVKYIADFT